MLRNGQLLLRVVLLAQRAHTLQLRRNRLQRARRGRGVVVQQAAGELRRLPARVQPVGLLPGGGDRAAQQRAGLHSYQRMSSSA